MFEPNKTITESADCEQSTEYNSLDLWNDNEKHEEEKKKTLN